MKLRIEEVQSYIIEMIQEIVSICERNNITYFLHCGSALGAIRHGGIIPWDHDADVIIPENEIKRFYEAAAKELSEKFYVRDINDKNSIGMYPKIGLRGYETDVLHVDIFRLIGIPNNRIKQLFIIRKAKLLRLMRLFKATPIKKIKSRRNRNVARVVKFFLLPFPITFVINQFNYLCTAVPFETAEYVLNPSGHYKEKNIFKKEIFQEYTTVQFHDIPVRIVKNYDFYLKQYYGDYMKYPPEEMRKRNMEREFIIREQI